MIKSNIEKCLLSGVGLLVLSGCSLASLPGGYTPIEEQTVSELNTANYIPRSADERAAILTQDLFAQAAFWSREYDLNPADLEAAINLANTLRRLDNPYKSIEITQTTRALYPRNVELMAELAAAYIAINNPKEALPILDTALGQRSDIARLWSLKGAALDQFEQFAQARQHYSKALSLAPNDPGIIANVGLSYALEGDPKTAEIWLRRAAVMPGASPSVRQNLSLVLGLQNKFGEAEKWAARDLDKEATANNMSYIRKLRGAAAPVVDTRPAVGAPRTIAHTYEPQTYGQQIPNRSVPARQTALAGQVQTGYQTGYQAGYQAGHQTQYQRPPAPSQFNRPNRPIAPIQKSATTQKTNPYSQPIAPPTKLSVMSNLNDHNGPRSSRDAALAAARAMPSYSQPHSQPNSQPNSQMGNGQHIQHMQNPISQNLLQRAPQSVPQDVLGRIAKNNTPKTMIAQQQRQQLAARTQAQYQARPQVNPQAMQAGQAGQYQSGYSAAPAYPQYVPPNMPARPAYGQIQPGALPSPPVQNRQPARQRRR